jgi:hypothetical protein
LTNKPIKLPSQVIREKMNTADTNLTINSLVNAFGNQGFGFMFVVMGLPVTIPLPPGVGVIPAAFLFIWSLQKTLGRKNLWIPKWLGEKAISPKVINNILSKALPLCERLENITHINKRNNFLSEQEICLGSLIVVIMSLLIALPTPFLNTIPAIITILIGLALISSNRGLLWVNMGLGVLATLFIGFTIYLGIEALLDEIVDFIDFI